MAQAQLRLLRGQVCVQRSGIRLSVGVSPPALPDLFPLPLLRLDATRPSLGELGLLGLINEALGAKVWRETMVVLTHANACRAALGAQYEMYSRQRRNIVMQLIRQAASDGQVRDV